jgi:hypothetical protein
MTFLNSSGRDAAQGGRFRRDYLWQQLTARWILQKQANPLHDVGKSSHTF